MCLFGDITWPAVSAIAAIVALLIALLNVAKDAIVARWRRPLLKILSDELVSHSSIIDEKCYLRLPIANVLEDRRRAPAKNVEVFLTSIVRVQGPGVYNPPRTLPIRLKWCHGGAVVSDRLACGAKRLLELGHVSQAKGLNSDGMGASLSGFFGENVVELHFAAEVSMSEALAIPSGEYRLGFLVASDQTAEEFHLKIHFCNRPPFPGMTVEEVVLSVESD